MIVGGFDPGAIKNAPPAIGMFFQPENDSPLSRE